MRRLTMVNAGGIAEQVLEVGATNGIERKAVASEEDELAEKWKKQGWA